MIFSSRMSGGTGNFGASSTTITELPNVSLASSQYFLIQEARIGRDNPPTHPDVIDATPIAMRATGGKVALVNTNTSLGCNGNSAVTSTMPANGAVGVNLDANVDLTFNEAVNVSGNTCTSPAHMCNAVGSFTFTVSVTNFTDNYGWIEIVY